MIGALAEDLFGFHDGFFGLLMPGVNAKPALAAILLALLFCAVSAGLIAGGRGVPAVFDGNETFSSILHARNSLAFGVRASAGLADESTSRHPQAHPVVHTHQGNFPRLYATLLYAAGLTGAASQVLATTLPVGVAAVLLLFAALYRLAGFAVATISLAILITDYILFAQWQVVTYRVWHFALTASLLAITVFYRSSRHRWLLVALFATSLCLFYYELVFAVFLSVAVGVLALVLWRKDIVGGLLFLAVQFAGAVAGAAVLIAQLIAYLGWQGFLTDLQLTYVSRNLGVAAPERAAALRSFVEQHNIAYLYNFADAGTPHSGRLILDTVFRWGLQAYTPPFAYCILVIACGVLVALVARQGRLRAPNLVVAATAVMALAAWLFGSFGLGFVAVLLGAALVVFVATDSRRPPQPIASIDAVAFVGVPAFLFVLMAATFSRFPGFTRTPDAFFLYGLVFTAALAALFALMVLRPMPRGGWTLPLDAAARGAALLCAAMAFSRFHSSLYDEALAPLWRRALPGPYVPTAAQAIAMTLATACAVALAMLGPAMPDAVRQPLRKTGGAVAVLVGCFLAGLVVVVFLSPGYVFSGYMARYLNLMVLPFALCAGFSWYAAVTLANQLIGSAAGAYGKRAVAAGLVLPASLAAWWLAIQVADARIFPPNALAVVNALEALGPDRPTIVANSYPAPLALATGQWAYLDETFASGRIAVPPASDYRYVFDRKYLWVADGETNAEYERPDVFVCLLAPSYRSAVLRMTAGTERTGCSFNRLVQLAERHAGRAWPHHTIVARDQSARDAWAIVKLDWDFPPYLTAKPVVAMEPQSAAVSVVVSYDFRQQDGKSERQTDIEVWPIARDGVSCLLRGAPVATAKASGGKVVVAMPPAASDTELVALARPRTATRTGAPSFSLPFNLQNGASVAAGPPCGLIRDEDERNWAQTTGG